MKRNEKGLGLIVAIFIIVLLALLAVIGTAMLSTDVEVAVQTLHSTRALYIAEAGIQDVFYQITNDEDFRDNPDTVTGDIGGGSYSVTVNKEPDDITYTLTSTGTIVDTAGTSIIRKIQVSGVATSSTLQRAIHGDGAHVKFFDSTGGTVNGNVSCFTDVLNLDYLANYQDFLDGTYTVTDKSSDPPQARINPALDTSLYLALAQEDDLLPDGEDHVALGTGVDGRLTLGAGTHDGIYYATNQINIEDGAILNGSAICEGGPIYFEKGPITVTIRPEQSTRAQGNRQNYPALYSTANISSTGTAVGKVGLRNSTINNLVMAGGDISFDFMDNTTFNGTLIADQNLNFQNAVSPDRSFVINYDVEIFSPMIVGFTFTGGQFTVMQQDDWQEIEY